MISDVCKREVAKPRKAFEVSNGKYVGFIIPDDLVDLIRDYITGLIEDNISRVIVTDWTLNSTWKEDGEQVTCYFPFQHMLPDHKRETIEMLSDEKGNITLRRVNYVDETDRAMVGELCGMVARGEIEVQDDDR